MEAYTKSAVISGHEAGDANGYAIDKGGKWNVRLRVNGASEYVLDRWE